MENDHELHRQSLIRILQAAYSGERAAAFAYRGHWKSVRDPDERMNIHRIEDEEWSHRHDVGVILEKLGSKPLPLREVRMWLTGRVIGAACHVIGWFLPMYFAGRLEQGNVAEYEHAADHAGALGLEDYRQELIVMAKTELEHEVYFRSVIGNHKWLPFMKKWFGWG